MENTLGFGSLVDLGSLLDPATPPATGSPGTPMRLEISLIREDPEQPRKHFDEEKLTELAASITERGVKTPISVRKNPAEAGTYLINHGARRYRASVLAGMKDIPAYVDDDYSLIDQTVENIQRDNLTPREIADVIGRLMASGMKKGEIARKLGKSPAFVTQHSSILDLPEVLAKAFNSGQISDLTVLNDLNALHKKNTGKVCELLEGKEEITRTDVRNFKEFMEQKQEAPLSSPANNGEPDSSTPTKEKVVRPKVKKQILQVSYQNKTASLILDKPVDSPETVWIRFEGDDSKEEKLVLCSDIERVISVIEES